MGQARKKERQEGVTPLPLRWVVILTIGAVVGVIASTASIPVVGFSAGLATVMTLHKIVA